MLPGCPRFSGFVRTSPTFSDGYEISRSGGLPSDAPWTAALHELFSIRFLTFDIRGKRWSEEILSACELTADRFAIPVPAGTVVGN